MNTEDLNNISKELEKELSKIEYSNLYDKDNEFNNIEDFIDIETVNVNEDINSIKDNELSNNSINNDIINNEPTPIIDLSPHTEESKDVGYDNFNIDKPTDEELYVKGNIKVLEEIDIASIDFNNININIDIESITAETESINKYKSKRLNFKALPKWIKVSSIVFLVMLVMGITGVVGLRTLAGKLQYERPEDVIIQDEDFDDDLGDNVEVETVAPEDIILDMTANDPRFDKNVINILLIGEDKNPADSGRGRSDAIIIASVNKSQKALKLTSIMRDCYVQIPGYSPNKINASYSIGGAPLLVSTIEQNFDIKIDGYASVNFNSFETIIDKLGGIELTLTSAEASYLRRTNYISNKVNRNVVEGKQLLNGNQVLGYTRVRYVGNSDFERTNRHKRVISAVYDKYKTVSITKMIEIIDYIFPKIKTNMVASDIVSYATSVITLGVQEIDTFRIPMDNAYEDKWVGRMRVLLPDFNKNIDELHKFLFGDEWEEETTVDLTTE